METTKPSFEEFYKQYYPIALSHTRKKIGSYEDAEDLVSNAFIYCYEHYDTYDPEKAPIGAWLFLIVNSRLDQCCATAEVLEDIALALEGSGVKILVDGGIRSGTDVFKALALGADAVLIARPFVTALYGKAAEGVIFYADKIGAELEDVMQMCGAHSLDEIERDMVKLFD